MSRATDRDARRRGARAGPGDAPRADDAARARGSRRASARDREFLHAAARALARGRIADASCALERTGPASRRDPEFLRLLGTARHREKRLDAALSALYGAALLQPGNPQVLVRLGASLRAAGRAEAALAVLRQACAVAPQSAPAWSAYARALAAQGRIAEACAAFEHALRHDAHCVNARIGYGDALRAAGRIDEAVGQFRLALREPGSVRAWGRLANIGTLRFDARDAARLECLFRSPVLGDAQRAIVGFALAKALEDQERYAAAFAVLGSANALRRSQVHWDPDAFRERNERIRDAFAAPPATASPAELGREVIFVVSLPRSGSTLVEHILASHPGVEGANELPDLWRVVDGESRRRGVPFPDWVADAAPGDWHRLGREYLARTARWRRARPRFTDKGLSNWRLIGAARAMLPGARFVHCRRDPLETCLSCYRRRFAKGQAFSYDFAELAACWHSYDALMRFWRTLHSRQIHDLVHEALLADPPLETRRLLRFCGLSSDPACLRPHETRRRVSTISAAQVRAPLLPDTRRAHRYGDLLAPLREALGMPAPASRGRTRRRNPDGRAESRAAAAAPVEPAGEPASHRLAEP